ncbi:MAG TPA: phage tail protein [Bacteroidetes bacterium]|nr:phage tail protein [Bacteroidota bacterium]
MPTFGLITEGPTDQVVIKHILFGVFNDPDLPINQLQPKNNEPGNWVKVLDYCCSGDFKPALIDNDYLIVQIDTDVLISEKLPEKYKVDLPSNLSVEEIIGRVAEMLISLIDDENNFWEQYGKHIIFAISVHQLECWLLPIYFTNKKTKAAKITGCIDTLNEVLPQQEKGLYIHGKDLGYYKKMSKQFRKKIHKIYHLNPSLKIFVEQVLVINEVVVKST